MTDVPPSLQAPFRARRAARNLYAMVMEEGLRTASFEIGGRMGFGIITPDDDQCHAAAIYESDLGHVVAGEFYCLEDPGREARDILADAVGTCPSGSPLGPWVALETLGFTREPLPGAHPPVRGQFAFIDLASRLEWSDLNLFRKVEKAGHLHKVLSLGLPGADGLRGVLRDYPSFMGIVAEEAIPYAEIAEPTEYLARYVQMRRPDLANLQGGWRYAPAALRRLAGYIETTKGATLTGAVTATLSEHALKASSPERIPVTPDAWQANFDLMDLRLSFESLTGLKLPGLTDVRGGAYRDVVDRIGARFRHADDGGIPQIKVESLFRSLSSPMRQFAENVVLPMAFRAKVRLGKSGNDSCGEGHYAAAYRIMYGDKSIRGISDLRDDFIARYAGISQSLGYAVKGMGLAWEPGIPEPLALGGDRVAHCLVTPEELLYEGDPITGLNHCVAGYYVRCLAGNLAVFSIRVRGKRVETASFEFDEDEGGWSLMEHYGHSNSEPGLWAREHRAALIARLAECSPRGLPKAASAGMLHDDIGYDPMRPKAIKGVAEAFLPLLPRNVRKAGAQGLLDAIRAMGVPD